MTIISVFSSDAYRSPTYWYPSKDSNLHFTRFELVASAVGLEGYTEIKYCNAY